MICDSINLKGSKIMEEILNMFDLLPEEEAARFNPIKSTDWKWTFADYPKEKNGLKVFSCFACGGGSTMGYKLAGCDVIGCCEIDPKMNGMYVNNHHPKHNFLMDIRDFNAIPNEELPEELFDLDVLDGSPHCTTFSMAGDREDNWGKKKKFREGQKEQTLDDLSFIFIETVNKLKPRVVVIENVEGLILGEAFTYVQKIYKKLDSIGYKAHHWLLKGELMGVPQTRHRVFFVAIRNDIGIDPANLNMSFNYEPVTFGQIKTEPKRTMARGKIKSMAEKIKYGDTALADVAKREYGINSFFNYTILYDDKVCNTIPSKNNLIRYDTREYIEARDVINAQTFPQDYVFDSDAFANISYICEMSVPPVMMKRIVQRLISEGVFSYKGVN